MDNEKTLRDEIALMYIKWTFGDHLNLKAALEEKDNRLNIGEYLGYCAYQFADEVMEARNLKDARGEKDE